jgi:hypothetical protein
MCAQAVETMDHIIFGCVLSQQIWTMILTKLHLQDQIQVQEEDVMLWWIRIRKVLPKENRRSFDSIFFLLGWTLWKVRNVRTFRNDAATPSELLQDISGVTSSLSVMVRAKKKLTKQVPRIVIVRLAHNDEWFLGDLLFRWCGIRSKT